MDKRKSIGFFGGSFDPIHAGHIHLALSMLEIYGLDQVLFCPAFISPFKLSKKPSASASHRLEMIKKAIEPIPHFSLFDYEHKSEKVSYTIDSLQHLRAMLDEQGLLCDLYLILGDDTLIDLHNWKEIDEVLKLARPLIGMREGAVRVPTQLSLQSQARLQEGMTQMPILDISSTLLRKRLKKRLYCGHLVPHDVLQYIYLNQLYE